MKRWERFLSEIGGQERLVIVGPLLKDFYISSERRPIVYVDGGVKARNPQADGPSIAVGDGDSSVSALDVVLPTEKDYSDLAFVLRHLPLGARHLELRGFLGGRRDHELANFGEVHEFLKRRGNFSTVAFDDSVIAFSAGRLQKEIHDSFSLMVLEPCSVTIRGKCKFAVEKPLLLSPLSSHGLSNVGNGLVEFEVTGPAFVILSRQ